MEIRDYRCSCKAIIWVREIEAPKASITNVPIKTTIAFCIGVGNCAQWMSLLWPPTWIKNSTSDTIVVVSSLDIVPEFPSVNKTEFYLCQKIIPGGAANPCMSGKNGWRSFIYRSKNKKLNLIVYKIDLLRKYQSIKYSLQRCSASDNSLNFLLIGKYDVVRSGNGPMRLVLENQK